MRKLIHIALFFVLVIVFAAGCGQRGDQVVAAYTKMEKQSLAEYREAKDARAAITVLEAYIARADWFGTHGIKATSLPNLKFWAEARLPELYDAIGDSEKAEAWMSLAVQHSNGTLQAMQHSATTNLLTPEAIREAVHMWDRKLKPQWRKKDSQ